MKTVVIVAKKWRDENGNTYHRVCGYDTQTQEQKKSDITYGYGSRFVKTAADLFDCDTSQVIVLDEFHVNSKKLLDF